MGIGWIAYANSPVPREMALPDQVDSVEQPHASRCPTHSGSAGAAHPAPIPCTPE